MTIEKRLAWAVAGGIAFAVVAVGVSYLLLLWTGQQDALYAWAVLMATIHAPLLFVLGAAASLSIVQWRRSKRIRWASLAFLMVLLGAGLLIALHWRSDPGEIRFASEGTSALRAAGAPRVG